MVIEKYDDKVVLGNFSPKMQNQFDHQFNLTLTHTYQLTIKPILTSKHSLQFKPQFYSKNSEVRNKFYTVLTSCLSLSSKRRAIEITYEK